MTLVDQIKTKELENGSLPSKTLKFLQKRGEKGMAGSWKEGQGQGFVDHRGVRPCYSHHSSTSGRSEGDMSRRSSSAVLASNCFLFPLLLCPWMPHENFRISLVETVCERTARSLFSYTKTEQCACVQERVCVRVVWGNGKKLHPMFAREEVDTTISFSAFHKTELLVAIGLCFWSLTEETRLGLASGLLVYF